MIAWLRSRTTAQLLVLAAGVAAFVFFVRIVSAVEPSLEVLVLMLGLCAAWGANVGAALLLGLAVVDRIRRRPMAPESGRLAVLLLAALGVGWLLVGLALLLVAFSDATMLLVVAGIAVSILALRLRSRPPAPRIVLAVLVGIVAGFQIPREIGTYSLTWETSETRHTWNASGGHNCTGTNLGDRPAAIAPYQPEHVIDAQLGGTLGELVVARLGQAPPSDPSLANVRVTGHVDYDGIGCYVPFYKSLHVTADVTTDTLFSPRLDDASLQCSASHRVTIDIDVETTGVAACRNLAEKAAQVIADQLHAHARSICGRP